MSTVIEEKLKKCKCCNKTTKHLRNNTKSSGFAIFVHILLTLGTMGFWLVVILAWKLLFSKIGGWICSECGRD